MSTSSGLPTHCDAAARISRCLAASGRRIARFVASWALLSLLVVLVGCMNIETGAPRIHVAAGNGKLEVVQKEVKRGVSVNLKAGQYGTPLGQAAMTGTPEVAEWLLANGADVNSVGPFGTTPLWEACKRSREPMIEVLLRHKANPNLASFVSSNTPLLLILSSTGHVDRIVEQLLQAGANASHTNKAGEAALLLNLARRGGEVDHVTDLLLKAGANPRLKNPDGWAPVHLATEAGALESLRLLQAAGAPLDTTSDTGATPLFQASLYGRTNVVDYLISQKVNLEKRNVNGDTPLFAASANGHAEVCRSLLRAGARLDAANDYKVAPLAAAIVSEQFKSAAVLVEAGATLPLAPADAPADSRYYSAVYQKLKADHLQALGQSDGARTNYQAALTSLTTVREEFTKTAKANTSKAARKEFWGAVLSGMAQGLASAGASYGSYQTYKTSAQMSALRHSSTHEQYFANSSHIQSYSQYSSHNPPPAPLYGQPSPGGGKGVADLRASAAMLQHRAGVCDELIKAIQQALNR